MLLVQEAPPIALASMEGSLPDVFSLGLLYAWLRSLHRPRLLRECRMCLSTSGAGDNDDTGTRATGSTTLGIDLLAALRHPAAVLYSFTDGSRHDLRLYQCVQHSRNPRQRGADPPLAN